MVMDSKTLCPQSVGQEFVRQYYTLLNKAPLHMHRFYSSDSSFVHGGLETKDKASQPVLGQQQIHQRIMQLNFRDCKAKIRQVDAHATLKDSVVVQVSGELSNQGLPMRRFMQTFVLAQQSQKTYYVHNDIFRYQDEVFSEDDEVEDGTECELEPGGILDPNVSAENEKNCGVHHHHQQTAGMVSPDSTSAAAATSSSTTLNNVMKNDLLPTSEKFPPNVGIGGDGITTVSINSSVPPHHLESTRNPPGMPETVVDDVSGQVNGGNQDVTSPSPSGDSSSLGGSPKPGEVGAAAAAARGHPGATRMPPATRSCQQTTDEKKINDVIEDLDQIGSSAPPSNEPQTYANLVKSGSTGGTFVPPATGKSSLINSSSSTSTSTTTTTTTTTSTAGGGEASSGGSGSKDGGGSGYGGFRDSLGKNYRYGGVGRGFGMGGRMLGSGRDRYSYGCMNRNELLDREGQIQDSPQDRRRTNPTTTYPDSQQIFVGNLPHNCREYELEKLFSKYGKVAEIRISSKGVQQTKTIASGQKVPNFGFVVFESEQSVKEALSEIPISLSNGHRLNIENKKNKVSSADSVGCNSSSLLGGVSISSTSSSTSPAVGNNNNNKVRNSLGRSTTSATIASTAYERGSQEHLVAATSGSSSSGGRGSWGRGNTGGRGGGGARGGGRGNSFGGGRGISSTQSGGANAGGGTSRVSYGGSRRS